MNEKELIDYYLNAKDKKKAIQDIKEETGLSIQEIYRKLRKNDILPPSKFKNNNKDSNGDEGDEWEDVEDDISNDKSIIGNIILAKIEEYWGDRKDISLKNKDIAYGILKSWEIKYGIDSWKILEGFIINTEKILAKTELEKALQDIKEDRNPFETFESVLQDYTEASAREILKSLQQPPEAPEPETLPPKEPFLNEQFMNFLAIKNPMVYRTLKIISGETDPLIPITNILEQIKKLSPKEREKLFSGIKKS